MSPARSVNAGIAHDIYGIQDAGHDSSDISFSKSVSFYPNTEFKPESFIVARRGGGGGGSRSRATRPSRKTQVQKTPPKQNKSKANVRKTNKNTNLRNANKKSTKKADKKNKKRKLSKADKKLAEKAKKSGKYHETRKEARADFNKKNKGKYPSKYSKKPATRPDHIPKTVQVNGTTVNINYNSGYGGYGYMSAGIWIGSDIAVSNMMMMRQGYFIAGAHPVMIIRPWYACFISIL